ncbi:DUF4169 family protein [Histidinibacterium aquaticum]|uniref:DUF4169 family protein n=1 Tax=Histidinibacterium aquaticum TaxID=2613962 RepID=A0A5J5GN66_9RHOB|nr:DUF4169 family protein [Histidinibacterium aquaticum]KAA9009781.1 DUF4169 family protein [Histidinibacterium aquaticum]
MKKVVNLRQVRKTRDRAEEKRRADENAVRHGRSKAQRLLETAQAEAAKRRLDSQKFEDSDG